MTQSEVSRRGEIRALFIFGLLAVFASIRVQSSQFLITIGQGSIDLVPVLDAIIGLWSLYAFFMVVGLSGDVIGKNIANVFREVSTVFLQYSSFLLVVFLFPAGFVAYAERFILMLFLIILVFAVGFVLYRKEKPSSIRNQSKLSAKKKSWNLKKHVPFIVGLIFLFSTYALLNYPKTWLAPFEATIIAYIVCAVSVTILLFLRKQQENDNDTYTSDDDYYC